MSHCWAQVFACCHPFCLNFIACLFCAMLNLLNHNCQPNSKDSFNWIDYIIFWTLCWIELGGMLNHCCASGFQLNPLTSVTCHLWCVKRWSAEVTALALSPCQRFLVVGDNHERVRVSCYPEAHPEKLAAGEAVESCCFFFATGKQQPTAIVFSFGGIWLATIDNGC